MPKNSEQIPPLPDKKIPASVMLIGTFEIGMALLGLIVVVLAGQLEANILAYLVLLLIYGTIGAGLLAIQEWARFANVVLHLIAIPYAFYTVFFLDAPADWRLAAQVIISWAIIVALTRPAIRYKFQTAVPKNKQS